MLEPIYKIFAHCLGEEKDDLAQTLAEAGKIFRPSAFAQHVISMCSHLTWIFGEEFCPNDFVSWLFFKTGGYMLWH